MNAWSIVAAATLMALLSNCADGSRAADRPAATAPNAPPLSPLRTRAATIDDPVVIVTIDGVRWQEVFEGTDETRTHRRRIPPSALLPNLYLLGTEHGAFIGAPGHGVISASGPEHVSLPGYTEILGGRAPHHCLDNDCARTPLPTLLDEAHARGARVAAFSSWAAIDLAITNYPGSFPAFCGRGNPATEAVPGTVDVRPDRLTAAAALAYYEADRPDVFYLGLGETDEYAHHDDYAGYLGALRFADEVVGRLVSLLQRDARGRRTHVVVLPDHGRSKGFASHGGFAPEAARVWMVAAGPRVVARGPIGSARERHLADAAPTLRLMLGVPADVSPNAGVPLEELFVSASRPL